MVGLVMISQMADALEALLKELHEKPKALNASTMRTVASAVDLLAILFQNRPRSQTAGTIPSANILVVDDEAHLSPRHHLFARKGRKLKCVSAEDPNAAFDFDVKRSFSIWFFLDRRHAGHETASNCCTKIARFAGLQEKRPLVFVTSLNDF